MTADVAIIIVGLDLRSFVEQRLRSLDKTEWHELTHQTVYVDNGSRDRTADAVRGEFPNVSVIPNPTNVGFCRACNQAMDSSDSRYIFYLNDDTIVMPDTIPRLVEFLESTPNAIAAGCRVFYPDMSEQWSARRFPTWKNALFGRQRPHCSLWIWPHWRWRNDF
jgi:GT2 family glycosyltransferase